MSDQAKRREELLKLVEVYHRSRQGDYDDTYAQFAADYGLAEEDDGRTQLEIPKYAAVRGDETYGMIDVVDSLTEAVAAESASIGEEYLMNPAGVYDLDTGQRIETVQVGMSKEAYIVLCGLVQPNWMTCGEELEPEAVNHGGIYSEAWDELRATFPLATFREAAQERGEDFYHEEAGL